MCKKKSGDGRNEEKYRGIESIKKISLFSKKNEKKSLLYDLSHRELCHVLKQSLF